MRIITEKKRTVSHSSNYLCWPPTFIVPSSLEVSLSSPPADILYLFTFETNLIELQFVCFCIICLLRSLTMHIMHCNRRMIKLYHKYSSEYGTISIQAEIIFRFISVFAIRNRLERTHFAFNSLHFCVSFIINLFVSFARTWQLKSQIESVAFVSIFALWRTIATFRYCSTGTASLAALIDRSNCLQHLIFVSRREFVCLAKSANRVNGMQLLAVCLTLISIYSFPVYISQIESDVLTFRSNANMKMCKSLEPREREGKQIKFQSRTYYPIKQLH